MTLRIVVFRLAFGTISSLAVHGAADVLMRATTVSTEQHFAVPDHVGSTTFVACWWLVFLLLDSVNILWRLYILNSLLELNNRVHYRCPLER